MSRIRTIKPEFWTSEQIMECSPLARLLFIGMWNFCDDQGVHPASSKTLKAEIFPADDITIDAISGLVNELIKHRLVMEFENNLKRYWHVTGWKHQLIKNPSTPKYPAPPKEYSVSPTPVLPQSYPINNDFGQVQENAGKREEFELKEHRNAGFTHDSTPVLPQSYPSPTVGVPPGREGIVKESIKDISANADIVEKSDATMEEPVGYGAPSTSSTTELPSKPLRIHKEVKQKSEKGTRWASDRKVPIEWKEWARKTCPALNVDMQAIQFENYWVSKAGNNAIKLDWERTWQNWIIKNSDESNKSTRFNNTPVLSVISNTASSRCIR